MVASLSFTSLWWVFCCLFVWDGFSLQLWLCWNSPCTPGWPQSQRSACFSLWTLESKVCATIPDTTFLISRVFILCVHICGHGVFIPGCQVWQQTLLPAENPFIPPQIHKHFPKFSNKFTVCVGLHFSSYGAGLDIAARICLFNLITVCRLRTVTYCCHPVSWKRVCCILLPRQILKQRRTVCWIHVAFVPV